MFTMIDRIVEARCADFIAHITEMDTRPITVTTGDGKPVVILHFVLSDLTKSIHVRVGTFFFIYLFLTILFFSIFSKCIFTNLPHHPTKKNLTVFH